MSRYYDASLMSGLGRMMHRRRRVGGLSVRRRRIGRGILSDIIGSIGLGRRRVYRRRRVGVGRRRRNGRGLWDIIKKVGSVALPFVKKSGVLGHLAGMIPGVGGVIKSGVQSLGYGRRRVHHRKSHGGLAQARRLVARAMGLGRRRRHVVHRRGRGILL